MEGLELGWSTLATQLEKQGVTNEGLTKNYSCKIARWEGFLLALAFPGASEGSKFASVALKTPCSDIPPQSSLRNAWCAYLLHFLWLTAWGSETIETKFCVLLHIKLVNRLKREEFLDVIKTVLIQTIRIFNMVSKHTQLICTALKIASPGPTDQILIYFLYFVYK